jgi:hypothetical protein
MHMIPKARPRRSPNRVTLVNIDGSAARPLEPSALAWPDWTDRHRYACPPDAAAAAAPTLPSIDPEPETDEEWLARLDATEAAELARIEASYRPSTADLAAYDAWLASVGDGPEPWAVEAAHRYDLFEAARGVTSDELAHLAAHGCV